MKESDLFFPVKNLLLDMGCSEVYGEVLNVDVLGLNGPVNVIVEMKTSLNFKLLDQIIDRKSLGQYAYIAIPKRKTHTPHFVQRLLKENKIGLIEVEECNWSKELIGRIVIPARFNRVANKRSVELIRSRIRDYHETQIGGKKSGETMTDYKATIEKVKRYLTMNRRGEWTKIDKILEYCETHYSSPKPSLSKALREFEHEWCEVTKIKNKLHFRSKASVRAV